MCSKVLRTWTSFWNIPTKKYIFGGSKHGLNLMYNLDKIISKHLVVKKGKYATFTLTTLFYLQRKRK